MRCVFSSVLVAYINLCVILSSQQIYRAAGKLKVLLTLVVTSVMSIRQLLILSGDVEVNPGPKGQHGEGKDHKCSIVTDSDWIGKRGQLIDSFASIN